MKKKTLYKVKLYCRYFLWLVDFALGTKKAFFAFQGFFSTIFRTMHCKKNVFNPLRITSLPINLYLKVNPSYYISSGLFLVHCNFIFPTKLVDWWLLKFMTERFRVRILAVILIWIKVFYWIGLVKTIMIGNCELERWQEQNIKAQKNYFNRL